MAIDLFKNLAADQLAMLRHVAKTEEFKPGDVIFRENDMADSLYVVMDGEVEVYRQTTKGEASIAVLGPPEVFGEMGLLLESRLRSASVRARSAARLAKIPVNPIVLSRKYADPKDTITLLGNVMLLLRRRLASNPVMPAPPAGSVWDIYRGWRGDGEKEIRGIIDELMKNKLAGRVAFWPVNKDVFLCRQGTFADSFFFLHRGNVEVLVAEESGEPQPRGTIRAPSIAGEVSFFTGRRRMASLRALEPVEYSEFKCDAYKDLMENEPDAAMELLYAALRLLVITIVRQQNPDNQ
jgi:CRP-like cAMP-binding protein